MHLEVSIKDPKDGRVHVVQELTTNGIFFNMYNRQIIVAFLLVLMGVTIAGIPICSNLPILYSVGALCGYGSGGLDTALVVWIVEIWTERSHLYLGGVEFFFGLGLCVAPMILRPYLPDFHFDDTFINTNLTMNSSNITDYNNSTNSNTHIEPQIEIPFAINGLFLVVSAILLLILHCYRPYKHHTHHSHHPHKKFHDHFKMPEKWPLIYTTFGVFIIGIFYGFEFMVFELLPTFIEKSYLQLSAYKSALIYAIGTATFTAARGLNVLVSIKFWSKNSIYLNLILIIIGNIILVLFETHEYSETVLIAGVVVLCVGLSTTYPSIYAFLESQLSLGNTVGVII
ncbi:unnamed protein product [Oppiella nova]|uniref:Sodium-dependent glucose transporter 1 n=1 Tax=Oppiella nova TaxID=334625 RepID=A0A7R9QJS6_9ACAR|nr:unnamed protein product [Oppiella nova]CAG2167234.1 unnamed protein product [Oppiella nova]